MAWVKSARSMLLQQSFISKTVWAFYISELSNLYFRVSIETLIKQLHRLYLRRWHTISLIQFDDTPKWFSKTLWLELPSQVWTRLYTPYVLGQYMNFTYIKLYLLLWEKENHKCLLEWMHEEMDGWKDINDRPPTNFWLVILMKHLYYVHELMGKYDMARLASFQHDQI